MIRTAPHYRRDAFVQGLKALGFKLIESPELHPEPSSLLVIWNRYGELEEVAKKYEAAGARVMVAENGYIGRDAENRQCYALAMHDHAGAGFWSFADTGQRWERLRVELKPWREMAGDYVLIAGQRGIGSREMASPYQWAEETKRAVERLSVLPVVIRQHPGNQPHEIPLEEHFAGADSVLVWASSVGIKALIAGIPVFSDNPKWIMAPATNRNVRDLKNPWRGDRLPWFHRLAWAQWTVDEIAAGEGLRWTLASGPLTS